MFNVLACCTCGPNEPFKLTTIQRRDPGPGDVVIDIAYAGICHSDVEHARKLRDGGKTMYPLVPGHEVAGVVSAVGSEVTKFRVGDRAGVGNMVDSCRVCVNCRAGMEQYCSGRRVLTYNSLDRDGQSTHGGYSQKIVVDEAFVVKIPESLPLENAAPRKHSATKRRAAVLCRYHALLAITALESRARQTRGYSRLRWARTRWCPDIPGARRTHHGVRSVACQT